MGGDDVVRGRLAMDVPVASEELLEAVAAHVEADARPPAADGGVHVGGRVADGLLLSSRGPAGAVFTVAVSIVHAEPDACSAEAEVLVWREDDGVVAGADRMEALFALIATAAAALGGTATAEGPSP